MVKNPNSAFHWDNGESSIFADDARFLATKNGKSIAQTRSESVTRAIKDTGKSPGTIRGISRAERQAAKSSNPHLHRSGCK